VGSALARFRWGVWSDERGAWLVRPDGMVFGTNYRGYAEAQAQEMVDGEYWKDARVRSFDEMDEERVLEVIEGGGEEGVGEGEEGDVKRKT
jgi:hypothetical protein